MTLSKRCTVKRNMFALLKSSEVELNSADKRPVNVGASDFATTMNYLYVVGRVLARDLRIKKYILGGVN